MSKDISELGLSRRERQILNVIIKSGSASVSDIRANIPNAPTDGATRRMLNIMREKGLLKSRFDGPRKVYYTAASTPGRILNRVVDTFFGGSSARAMAALFDTSASTLSSEEKAVLSRLIEKAKEEGR